MLDLVKQHDKQNRMRGGAPIMSKEILKVADPNPYAAKSDELKTM